MKSVSFVAPARRLPGACTGGMSNVAVNGPLVRMPGTPVPETVNSTMRLYEPDTRPLMALISAPKLDQVWLPPPSSLVQSTDRVAQVPGSLSPSSQIL